MDELTIGRLLVAEVEALTENAPMLRILVKNGDAVPAAPGADPTAVAAVASVTTAPPVVAALEIIRHRHSPLTVSIIPDVHTRRPARDGSSLKRR